MIALLVSIVVATIVVGLFYAVVSMLPLPAPYKVILQAVCLLILLIWICAIAGLTSEPAWRVRL